MTNSDIIFCIVIVFIVLSPFLIYMVVVFFHFILMKARLRKKQFGAFSYICLVKTPHTDLPIKNALIRVEKEHEYIQGKYITAAWGKTNERGLFVFWLNPGKYFINIWATHRNLAERMWILGDSYARLESYSINIIEHSEYLALGKQKEEKIA